MRLHEKEIEVFLSSRSPGNPYRQGAADHLLEGFYCETVIGTDSKLTVNNALDTSEWKDNPDVKLDMISYLGHPLKWPGGEFFGTVCLLDTHPREFDDNSEQLLALLQQSIEADLTLLSTQISLAESEARYKSLNEDKDRFFSILAHDLCSPFTTLLGLTEVLHDRLLDGDVETNLELVKTIYSSANSVFTLLENLLDWSRLQRNMLNFSPEETDFSVLAANVFNLLESSITTKKLTFNNQIEKGRWF